MDRVSEAMVRSVQTIRSPGQECSGTCRRALSMSANY